MGKNQEALQRLLSHAGYQVSKGRTPWRPSIVRGTGPAKVWQEIDHVYRLLGGILTEYPLRVGAWDVEVGAVAIELDEEQHFNRYRSITLQSAIYSELSTFPLDEYLTYCERYESNCLSKADNRNYWANSSTDNQFGHSSAPGDLDPPGSSRWKQRAFYDFLKDIAPRLIGRRMARISVWDTLDVSRGSVQLNEILDAPSAHNALALIVALVEARAGARLDRR